MAKKQIKIALPSHLDKVLTNHAKSQGQKRGDLMETAFRSFLEFYEDMSPERLSFYRLKAAPTDTSTAFRGSVDEELKERLDSIARSNAKGGRHQYADVYWTALSRYIELEDLFDDEWERSANVVAFSLYKEELNIIQFAIATGQYEHRSAFFDAAFDFWLEQRTARGPRPWTGYSSRPMGIVEGGDPDKVIEVTASVTNARHNALSIWAHNDYQSIRNVIYNAVVAYLDQQLDSLLEGMGSMARLMETRSAQVAMATQEEEET